MAAISVLRDSPRCPRPWRQAHYPLDVYAVFATLSDQGFIVRTRRPAAARPPQPQDRPCRTAIAALVCAAMRTLNAAGQSRVTLSLR